LALPAEEGREDEGGREDEVVVEGEEAE